MLIGLLSALAANVLAVPLTWLLETATGNIFLNTPLPFHMGAIPSLIWLALVLVLSTLGSLYPAWRAARLTVREALAYA
jgi:putative ABC transport system permease protein